MIHHTNKTGVGTIRVMAKPEIFWGLAPLGPEKILGRISDAGH
jgi:hypothetical protein